MRLSATKLGSIANSRSFGDQLFDLAGEVPNLDLNFAGTKTLDPRVTFTRASSGTYVGSDGLVKTATTNEARFDHNPATGESLGLLVEEARTNLSLRSQELDNAAWTKAASSITANAIASPDGTTTADKLVEDSSTANHNIVEATAITYTSGVTYSFSFFVKKAERQTVQILMHPNPFPGTTAQRTAIFNSNTGAFVSVGSAYTNSSVTTLPNGWYRVSVTSTADATTTGNFTISLCSDDAGTVTYTGDGTSGIYLCGAQLEAGAFATSYIPTTTATVTRAADVASITGSAFTSFYNQTEGTFFVDSNQASLTPASRLVSASDNTGSNRVMLSRGSGSSGNINTSVTNAGSAQVSALLLGTALAAGTSNKVAAIYKAADFAGSVNGLAPVTQSTGTVPGSLTQLTIGNGEILGNSTMTGTIKRLTYWPVRLANPTLQSITTP